ncbi:CBO0543 family protein [Bacillus sp. T33-2]|uniref:CBO0543 family protein n=1 Tax=Bacillus sp. T33-2 TaxID=2054168 RepID=UPI000C786DE2|nr:CBO0543 family protein [Bacillus sp. T33-2]PLR92855.1 hypothetical protein CVD19_19880 [Bacillus sp. T33-2]
MNIVQPLKSSNLPPSRKKRSIFNRLLSYFPAMMFASLFGTYSDLYFVGKGAYEFPARPFAGIFHVNIAFTLIALPLLTVCFLNFVKRLERWKRWAIIALVSAAAPAAERIAEQLGLFRHGEAWSHAYSFFGYLFFLSIIWKMYKWTITARKL